jgi:signal transduction histidine kinase
MNSGPDARGAQVQLDVTVGLPADNRAVEYQSVLEALKLERQRFHAVLNALPVYVALLSPDYRIPFANRVFFERFGDPGTRRCFEHLFERTEPCELCETYKALKTMSPHRWEWTGPDQRNYSIFDFPFTDSDGSTLILEMGIDVTERKQAETELERHRAHLEELVQERTRLLERANAELKAEIAERKRTELALQEARSKLQAYAEDLEATVERRTANLKDALNELEHFSYAITHDMRAPLRALQGFSAILEEQCADCHRGSRDYFRRIQSAAGRMDQLITDSLNYSRIARQDMKLKPVDISSLLQSLVETYPNLQPDKADIRIAANMPCVLGNEAALTQCFSNLLGNAVKFAQPGVIPKVRVWSEVRTEDVGTGVGGSFVRVWVEDNGIGIPKVFRKHLFNLFERGSHHHEGTGIGLAIVRKVAQRMGGRVGVESEEGKGSRFWVELQRA